MLTEGFCCVFFWQVIAYTRGPLLFVFNFHPTDSYEGYMVGVEEAGEYQVCLKRAKSVDSYPYVCHMELLKSYLFM